MANKFRIHIRVAVSALVIFIATAGYTQPSYTHINFGKHIVGFQSHFTTDFSRPSRTANEKGRVMQIHGTPL
jgi:hypothetical protein